MQKKSSDNIGVNRTSVNRTSGSFLGIAHSLNEGEKKYLLGRKISVKQCLEKNNIPCTLSEVPNIAVIGSGGGMRAMVGLLGTLYQMGKEGLLDSALYMSGVSGSTWCMASVYDKPNWSSDIEQIKTLAERLGESSFSEWDTYKLLRKYFYNHEHFSLTDVWASLVVPDYVKKIDTYKLSNYKTDHEKDPYPIYTVVDKDCKSKSLLHESFFELTPHEAGYSLAGAFVETSTFGSIFNKGALIEEKMEMDMIYLQGVCGSALADADVIVEKLKEYLQKWGIMKTEKDRDNVQLSNALQSNLEVEKNTDQREQLHTMTSAANDNLEDQHEDLDLDELHDFVQTLETVNTDLPLLQAGGVGSGANDGSGSSHGHVIERFKEFKTTVKREAAAMEGHDGPKLLLNALKLNTRIFRGKDWTPLVDELNVLLTGKQTVHGRDLRINKDELVEADAQSKQNFALGFMSDICKSFSRWFVDLKNAFWQKIVRRILRHVQVFLKHFWIWGTNYNFLHNMTAPDINPILLKNETSHFEDAGLLVNSPFMSVLRAERNIDLIISFDFSEGDPMETVSTTAKQCKDLGISFPAINYTKQDASSPKDFYVFKGNKKVPTVIHIPLFNVKNCGSELEHYREKYKTFQTFYSPEMIEDLMTKAGENVTNNKKNILREIELLVKKEPWCWML